MTTTVSAYILSYKNFSTTTQKCLDTLLPQAYSLGVSVDVIENGSSDGTLDQILAYQKIHPGFDVQVLNENHGFAGGFNIGVRESESDWILVINSDIRFPGGSLSRLLQALGDLDTSIGIVAPLSSNAGNGQVLVGGHATFEQVEVVSRKLVAQESRCLMPIYRADFCCVAVRGSLWKMLGGLDLCYGRGYFEDFDFSLRARALGYKIVVCEDCLVFHEGGSSFKSEAAQAVLIKANKKKFLSKFPTAILENRREEVLRLMLGYCEKLNQKNKEALTLRFYLRKQFLLNNLPKSPLKKLWFRYRMKKTLKLFTNRARKIS